jgi:hypothetical protein
MHEEPGSQGVAVNSQGGVRKLERLLNSGVKKDAAESQSKGTMQEGPELMRLLKSEAPAAGKHWAAR